MITIYHLPICISHLCFMNFLHLNLSFSYTYGYTTSLYPLAFNIIPSFSVDIQLVLFFFKILYIVI